MTADTGVRAPTTAPAVRRGGRTLVRVLLVVLAVLALVPVVAVGRVLQAAWSDDRTPTDAVVVLGAAQFWGKPSPVLEARLQHARDLYRDGVAPRIVTVGGKQAGDRTTEAQVGKEWLAAQGVPSGSVTAVATGSDTLQSLEAVAALMDERGWSSATLVTDPAHEARSLAMARALGIEAHGSPSQSGDGSRLTGDYVAREAAGLLWFWTVGRTEVEQRLGS